MSTLQTEITPAVLQKYSRTTHMFMRLDALLAYHMSDDGTLLTPLNDIISDSQEHDCFIPFHPRLWLRVARINPPLEYVKLLLRNVDFIDKFRHGSKRNEQAMIKLALALDNEVVISLYKGAYKNVFHTACERGCANIVKVIIEHGAVTVPYELLWLTVARRHTNVVELLLKIYEGSDTTRLLHTAFKEKCIDIAKVLIRDGRVSLSSNYDFDANDHGLICQAVLQAVSDAELTKLLLAKHPDIEVEYATTDRALLEHDVENIKTLLQHPKSEWSVRHLSYCSTAEAVMVLNSERITLTSSMMFGMIHSDRRLNPEVINLLLEDERTPLDYIDSMIFDSMVTEDFTLLKLLLQKLSLHSLQLTDYMARACEIGKNACVKIFLEEPRLNPMSSLLGVVRYGSTNTVKMVLADSRIDWSIVESAEYNQDLAINACNSFNAGTLKYLIGSGIFSDESLREVLEWSIQYTRPDVTSLVLSKLKSQMK